MIARPLIETSDQVFVLLKEWLVGFLPASWQPAAGVVLCVAAIVGLFPVLFAPVSYTHLALFYLLLGNLS